MYTVQHLQTVCVCGGRGGVLNCALDHILQEFYALFLTRFWIYQIAPAPQTKWPVKTTLGIGVCKVPSSMTTCNEREGRGAICLASLVSRLLIIFMSNLLTSRHLRPPLANNHGIVSSKNFLPIQSLKLFRLRSTVQLQLPSRLLLISTYIC